ESTEPMPPYRGNYEFCDSPYHLWKDYERDQVNADKDYNGKVVKVYGIGGPEWSGRLLFLWDRQGKKYLPVIKCPEGKPNEWRKMIRCYLYRPENPIIEPQVGDPQAFGVKGVCKGMREGVIILENCTIFTYEVEGTDW